MTADVSRWVQDGPSTFLEVQFAGVQVAEVPFQEVFGSSWNYR